MSLNPDALCKAMQASIDEITLDWVHRIKEDQYIHSDDSLTLPQIIDHIPQMLEEICDLLVHTGEPDFKTIRACSEHGYMRAAEGYSLTDLLRELELLRDCVFNFVAETEIKQDINRDDTIRALRLINHYFGEDILFVTEQFLKNPQS